MSETAKRSKRVEILRAAPSGYCWGVERALEIIERTAAANPPGTVRTLGPVIHNPRVVAALEERGVRPVGELAEMDGGTVVVRTHGVAPAVYGEAERRGLTVVDATCPLVTLVQNRAKQLVAEGYHLVIFGNPRHPEVIGTLGHAGGVGTIIELPEQAATVPLPKKKVGVVVQTTQETELLSRCLAALAPRCKELKVFNTICNPTIERQEAARELARSVDVVVVVGSRGSSNTGHLAQVCREEGAVTYHVEGAEELDPAWFATVRRVGVTGGASTPSWMVDEVAARIDELAGESAAA